MDFEASEVNEAALEEERIFVVAKDNVALEKKFFDEAWRDFEPYEVTEASFMGKDKGLIEIPGIEHLVGKKILICSCGSGIEPTVVAKQGGQVFAFDISYVACLNAKKMATYNGVAVSNNVSDINYLSYFDDTFDLIYGCSILHHIDCALAGKELHRVLKPGGRAFFLENSDRNPILRFFRRSCFGEPDEHQKTKFLFFERLGSSEEYPLTECEVEILAASFDGNIYRSNKYFCFFYLLDYLIFRKGWVGELLWSVDKTIGRMFPFLKKYSFFQEILLIKSQ